MIGVWGLGFGVWGDEFTTGHPHRTSQDFCTLGEDTPGGNSSLPPRVALIYPCVLHQPPCQGKREVQSSPNFTFSHHRVLTHT